MRILYVLEHYHPYIGGAEKLFQDVAEKMAELGHDVTVVTTRFRTNLPPVEQHNKVRIIRIRCFNRYLFTLFALFQLFKIKTDFELIHTTTYNAAFPAWLFSKIKGIPSILTFHEVWGDLWFQLPFLNRIEKWAFFLYEKAILSLRFNRYIAVSQFTQDTLIGNGRAPDRVFQIYNGLDYDEIKPCIQHNHSSRFTFLYFGRLGVSKGLDLLIPAFKQVHVIDPSTKLILVVPRKPKKMLRKVFQLIDHNGIREGIELLHELSREELRTSICNSNAVVIPSYSEGFCFVAAEACALGKNVIHSGRGSLPEVVSGQQIRFEEMTVESLSNAMQKATNDKWEKGELIKFPLSTSILQYLKLYSTSL